MDRYQIAINKGHGTKPIAYRFKSSNSVSRVCAYMKQCIEDNVMFESGGISGAVLDSAIVKLSRGVNVPIITGTDKTAKSLSISHSYKKVFSSASAPKKSTPYAIYYWDISPSDGGPEPFLVVIR